MQSYRDIYLYVGVDGPVGDDIKDYLLLIDKQMKGTVMWFEENRGLARVLNDMVDAAIENGYQYIARMDADDISHTDRSILKHIQKWMWSVVLSTR